MQLLENYLKSVSLKNIKYCFKNIPTKLKINVKKCREHEMTFVH